MLSLKSLSPRPEATAMSSMPSTKRVVSEPRRTDVDPGKQSGVNESPQPACLGRGLDHETHQAPTSIPNSRVF